MTTRCREVNRWYDCIVASGLSPVSAMSDYVSPMTPNKVKSTEDAITFIDAIKAECQSRDFLWCIQLALAEFPTVEARVPISPSSAYLHAITNTKHTDTRPLAGGYTEV